ncbi:MAG: transposase [Chlorobi bacterium]|nr:transposase [Chlorobiota bacterium]MCI0717245.1 transposase [Chlorobiota bacterium]
MQERKQIHLKDFDYKCSCYLYFITICTFNKNPYFKNHEIAKVLEEEFKFRISKNEVFIYCYCIMPDHFHLLLSFTDQYNKSLQVWISSFKRFTSKTVKERFNLNKLWQRNFYEHIVRTDESFSSIAEYILNNQVRKGMVKHWQEYKFSNLLV